MVVDCKFDVSAFHPYIFFEYAAYKNNKVKKDFQGSQTI